MKIDIISSQASGIFKALCEMGFGNVVQVRWVRQPSRCDGMWRASIWV